MNWAFEVPVSSCVVLPKRFGSSEVIGFFFVADKDEGDCSRLGGVKVFFSTLFV